MGLCTKKNGLVHNPNIESKYISTCNVGYCYLTTNKMLMILGCDFGSVTRLILSFFSYYLDLS